MLTSSITAATTTSTTATTTMAPAGTTTGTTTTTATRSTGTGSPVGINGEYMRRGTTKDGRLWYSREDPSSGNVYTLYYDPGYDSELKDMWFFAGNISIDASAAQRVGSSRSISNESNGTTPTLFARTLLSTASVTPPIGGGAWKTDQWVTKCNGLKSVIRLSIVQSVCGKCKAAKLDCGPTGKACIVPADPIAAFGINRTVLDLSGMQLAGTLPDLSTMINLKVLDVSNNPNLDPGPVWSWLAQSTTLTELRVGNTNRNGDGGIDLSLLDCLEVLDLDSSCEEQWFAQRPDRGPIDASGAFINRALFIGRAADAEALASQDPHVFAYAVLGTNLYLYTADLSFSSPVYQMAEQQNDGSVGAPGNTKIAEWSYTEPGLQGFERSPARSCIETKNARFGVDGDINDATIALVSRTAEKFEYGSVVADWAACLTLCSTTAACQQVVYDESAKSCYGTNGRGNGNDPNSGEDSVGWTSAICPEIASKPCSYSASVFESGPLWPWLANLTSLRELRITSANRLGAVDPSACGLKMSADPTRYACECVTFDDTLQPNDLIQPDLLVSDSRPGECWFSCGGKSGRGLCSKCTGKLGALGACCKKGNSADPGECQKVPDFAFKHPAYHECVFLPEEFKSSFSGSRCDIILNQFHCNNTTNTCRVSAAAMLTPEVAFGIDTTVLDWSNKNLGGEIPDLSRLINLEVFNLQNNPGLSAGPIWPWLTKLTKLKELYLGNTNRNGDLTNFDF
eukprot:gene15754-26742_t